MRPWWTIERRRGCNLKVLLPHGWAGSSRGFNERGAELSSVHQTGADDQLGGCMKRRGGVWRR